jgi:hypothetical protein
MISSCFVLFVSFVVGPLLIEFRPMLILREVA